MTLFSLALSTRHSALRMIEPTPNPQQRPFRVCPACGQLTPGNRPLCVVCGEPSVEAMAEAVERADEERFASTFFARGAPATWAFIGANVAVYALMVFLSGAFGPPSAAYTLALVNFGAKVNAFVDLGEYWRFVTPIFIHIGPIHLLVNMYSLHAIGPQVERLYGTSRFIILYLLTGIAGVAGSYYSVMRTGEDGPSAGASGALFGLLGVLLVFGLRYKNELPGIFRQAFSAQGLIPVLAINLIITFTIPMIDWGAHLGGLVAGAVLAAVIPYFRSTERRAALVWQVLAVACVAVIVGSFVIAFRAQKRDQEAVSQVLGRRVQSDVSQFIVTYNDVNTRTRATLDALEKAADKQAVLPDVADSARASAAQARRGVGLDDQSEALMLRNAELLERSAALLSDKRSELTPERAASLRTDYKKLTADWDVWLEASGERFGITKENDKE